MEDQREPQRRLRLMRQVAVRADALAGQGEELGNKASASLGDRRRSQLTGLESIANSTFKLTDIWDYIKVRTARSEANKDWRANGFGTELLQFLQSNLAEHAKGIAVAERLSSEDQRQVQLLLTREFIGQVVAHYEFACIKERGAIGERH